VIRFSCPKCQTLLETADQGAGGQLTCPKCDALLQVPLPPPAKTVLGTLLPAGPAARRDTDLMTAPEPGTPGSPAASGRTRPAPPVRNPAPKSAVVCPSCGLRLKVKGNLAGRTAYCPGCGQQLSGPARQGGRASLEQPERPEHSWAGAVFAVLALGIGIVAVPVTVAFDQRSGAALAGPGLLVGFFGMFAAVLRGRGAGFGLSLAGTVVCGSVLLAALGLFGGGTTADDRRAGVGTARPADDDNKVGQEQPAPGKGKPPAKPDPRPGPEDRGLGPKLAKLVRDLKSERSADRIRAAEQLGKLKEEAKPAARALCEAATASEESVRQAALEALEKVHPRLYKPVSTLLVDNDAGNHLQAALDIKGMGEDGRAATPVVHAHLRRYRRPGDEGMFWRGGGELILGDMAALRAIAPDEPNTVKVMIELTTYEGQLYQGGQVRAAAATALGDLATRQPDRRDEIVKALVAATQYRPNYGNEWTEQPAMIAAITALGQIGPYASEAVPALRKLNLNPQRPIREAASAALEKIEPQR
jgi:HEAT repeat protein